MEEFTQYYLQQSEVTLGGILLNIDFVVLRILALTYCYFY